MSVATPDPAIDDRRDKTLARQEPPTPLEWKFPDVRRGDRAVWAKTPSLIDAENQRACTVMLITEVKESSVSGIRLTNQGHTPIFDARHWLDPTLKKNPRLLDEPYTGVFRLADAEEEVRMMARMLFEQDKLIAELAEDVARLKADVKVIAQAIPKGPLPTKRAERPKKATNPTG